MKPIYDFSNHISGFVDDSGTVFDKSLNIIGRVAIASIFESGIDEYTGSTKLGEPAVGVFYKTQLQEMDDASYISEEDDEAFKAHYRCTLPILSLVSFIMTLACIALLPFKACPVFLFPAAFAFGFFGIKNEVHSPRLYRAGVWFSALVSGALSVLLLVVFVLLVNKAYPPGFLDWLAIYL